MTDLAYRDMDARADGLFQRLGSLIGTVLRRTTQHPSNRDGVFVLGPEHTAHLKLTPLTARKSPSADHPEVKANGVFRWRRHPQLLNHSETSEPDPDDLERGARSAGVRGLFFARSGRFDDARAAFAMAAAESTINLAAIPGFWDLSRGGMHAAVNAYEDVERYRDASALGARIRLKYRPRSVSLLRDVVKRKTSALGSWSIINGRGKNGGASVPSFFAPATISGGDVKSKNEKSSIRQQTSRRVAIPGLDESSFHYPWIPKAV
ncbi:hypothetical protein BH20CHL3_BH20CHL3_02490 [soil metagenome]